MDCEVIKSNCHNHSISSKEDLNKFINCCLNTNISRLDISNRPYCDSDVLSYIASSNNAAAIIYLNCINTRVGYSGIVKLWNSMTFGSLSSGSPTYERHTGVPIVRIEIEIAGTRVLKQYNKKLFTYPLPLLDRFEITYGHRCIGTQYNLSGYKKIILLDCGVELSPQKLR